MDEYTLNHLRRWIDNHYSARDQADGESVKTAIIAFVNEHPEILESPRNASWQEIRDMVTA